MVKTFKAVAVIMYFEPIGTRREESCNKAAPTAKSIKNPHARPARMPQDNNFPLMGSETLEIPPELILITALPQFKPCPSLTVSSNAYIKFWVPSTIMSPPPLL